MNSWIVEYVDGKSEKFSTAPEGIQILQPNCPILVVHRTLSQPPIFLNLARVQKWYPEGGPSLAIAPPTNPAGLLRP